MREDEILAMSAGSGMDILIAEKVMKWKERVHFDYVDGIIAHYVTGTMDVVKFEPSTDINAAWMVVEMLRINHRVDMVIDSDYYVCVMSIDAMYESNADSAPEAICKVALLALA